MGRKKKAGRPKMAKNDKKQGFPLRLRPDLIKQLKQEATTACVKVGPYVEDILEKRTLGSNTIM